MPRIQGPEGPCSLRNNKTNDFFSSL